MNASKPIIIIFLIAMSVSAVAQNNSTNQQKSFVFGFSFSPDYTYRTLKTDIDDMGFIDMRDELESARFGFTTGLSVKYILNHRWVLESGLQYADRGDKIETEDTDYIFPEDGSDPFVPEKSKSINHYYYLGVPLKANFYLVNKNVKVFLSAGLSFDFFSGSKVKQVYTYEGETIKSSYSEENVDFNGINYVGLAGFGVEYAINNKLELRLEPIVRYSFSSLTTYTDIKTYLYSAGINFAVYFRK